MSHSAAHGNGWTPEDLQLIEAYLDDELDAAKRLAFESRLEREEALRTEIESQRTIDRRIRALFTPPSAEEIVAVIEAQARERRSGENGHLKLTRAPSNGPVRRRFTWRSALAVAAALMVGAVGVILSWSALRQRGYQPPPFQDFGEVYADARPTWECKPGPDFYRQYFVRYGQGLLIPEELPDNVQTFGFGYSHSLSEETVYLVAEVDGEQVVVFGDRAENAGGRAVQLGDRSLIRFERRIGGLVLYEVTPLDEPHLLDLFYMPERVPPGWTPGAGGGN